MQHSTTVTFQADKLKREESAEHDFRADITDPNFFAQKGHEHIIPEYCKLNIEITNEKLEDFYDKTFTEKLAVWSDKQDHKSKKVGGGKALPAGVSKTDAKYYAIAYAKKLYVLTGIKPDYLNQISLDDLTDDEQAKINKIYDGIKSKNLNFLREQIDRFASPVTAGEAYLQDLRVLMSKNGKVAQRTSYAYIIQVGSYLDPDYTEDRSSRYWSDRVKILEEWLEDFKKRHPHLHVTKAVIHVDEYHKPPHLHLEVVPVVESSRGKPLKVSFSEAIKQDGVDAEAYEEKEGKASYDARRQAFSDWTETERASLATLCKNALGLERKQGDINLQGASPAFTKSFMSSIDDSHQRLLRENRELDDKNLAAAAKLKQAEDGLKQSVEKKQSVDKVIAEAEAKLQTLQTQLEDAESRGLEAKKKALRSRIADMRTTVDDLQVKSQQVSKDIAEKRTAFDDEKAEFFGEKRIAVDAVKQVYQGLSLPVPAGIEAGKLSVLSSQVTTLMRGITDQGKAYQDAKVKADAETKRADTAYAAEVKAIETSKASFTDNVQSFFKACGMTPPKGDVADQVDYLTKHRNDLVKRYQAASKKVQSEEKRADMAYETRLKEIDAMKRQLNAKEKALDAMIEEKAEAKAKTKITYVLWGFFGHIKEGYGEFAYKIKHRWGRAGYDKNEAILYGQNYQMGVITDTQLEAECLSRNPVIKGVQTAACSVAGIFKAVTHVGKDAKAMGISKDEIDMSLPAGMSPEACQQNLTLLEKSERQLRQGRSL